MFSINFSYKFGCVYCIVIAAFYHGSAVAGTQQSFSQELQNHQNAGRAQAAKNDEPFSGKPIMMDSNNKKGSNPQDSSVKSSSTNYKQPSGNSVGAVK